jgi:hypothetical protein
MIKRFTIKRIRSKHIRSKHIRSKHIRSKRIRSKQKSKKSKSKKNKTQKGGNAAALQFLRQVRAASPAIKETCKNSLKEFVSELYVDTKLGGHSPITDYLKKFAKENIKSWIEKKFKDISDIKFIERKEPIEIFDNNKHFKEIQKKFKITEEDYNEKLTQTIHELLLKECIDIKPELINVEDEPEPELGKVPALSEEELKALIHRPSLEKKNSSNSSSNRSNNSSSSRRSTRRSSRSSNPMDEVDG